MQTRYEHRAVRQARQWAAVTQETCYVIIFDGREFMAATERDICAWFGDSTVVIWATVHPDGAVVLPA